METKKCWICREKDAIKDQYYGWLACVCCRKAQSIYRTAETIEVVTGEIREQRKQYEVETTQPFRQGQLSREFVRANPQVARRMVKEGRVTQEEVSKAKNVWPETSYYKKD